MEGELASLYTSLTPDREAFLRRAREAAKFTIPYLMPQAGHTGHTDFGTPHQAVGSAAVNALASKLLISLFPPNQPFFRYKVDDYLLEELTQRPAMRAEVEKALNRAERAIQDALETSAARPVLASVMRQLVVAGNALLHIPPEGSPREFRLDSYVVRRDPSGNLIELVVQEHVSPNALPPEVRAAVPEPARGDEKNPKDAKVAIYTGIRRDLRGFRVWQEAAGQVVPGSQGFYPIDQLPWLPLRFTSLAGEHYGRGYVEDYIGDFRTLDGLEQAIGEGSIAMARILFLLDPNGVTDLDTVAEAPNLAIRSGRGDDVSVVQTEKAMDFRVAAERALRIEARLERAFLMVASVQRNGERVTAEEIRTLAGELEDTLGGIYSLLSQELQLPLVRIVSRNMEASRRMPPLPAEVKPAIVTGLEALGRGHDLARLETFVAGLAAQFGPEEVAKRMNVSNYITRRGTALGIDMDGLVRSDEEVQQMEQAAQMQAMIQQLGPNVINQIGAAARTGAAPAGEA